MPQFIAANTFEIVLSATQEQDQRITVLHVFVPDNVLVSVEEVADVCLDFFGSNGFLSLFSSSVFFQLVTVKDIRTGPDQPVATRSLQGFQGANTADNLPGNVAAVVSLHTAFAGRSNRGRIYMYGLTTDDFVPGFASTLSTGYMTAALASWNQLMTALAAANVALAVCSRIHHDSKPVTTLTMDPVSDSQRRRLPGRGR